MKTFLVVVLLAMMARADDIDEAGLLYRAENAERVANAQWKMRMNDEAQIAQMREEIQELHKEIETCQQSQTK